jgi:hypothetical protein
MNRSEVMGGALGFLLLTVAITWPLGADLAHTLASDYGDPLFACWIIGWVADHLTRGVGGNLAALRSFWDANIFFPEPHTLAFAEHLFAETVQVLPIYWATGNLLLCYNVTFLLSFVLSGLGAQLLLRDLTGSPLAGFAAGVFFAFNEYRLSYEVSHLQTLSNHWLPFALLGLHRYVATGSRLALIGGAAALVALNLSAGFHLLYGGPFVVAFVLADLLWHQKARNLRVWGELSAAAAATVVLTIPFYLPYLAMQRQLGFERPLEEVIRFSATLDQYWTALPGFSVPLLFAVLAVGLTLVKSKRDRHAINALDGSHEAAETASARAAADNWVVAFAVVGLVLAFWLSLGPVVQAGGRALAVPGAYGFLYNYVPGYRGLRAAARFATLFFFFLALLAGSGVALVESRSKRAAQVMVLVGCGVFIWQCRPAPFPVDRAWPFVSPGLAPPPAYLHPGPRMPAVYRWIVPLDPGAVLVEFPVGDSAYELRYMFFSSVHGRRMLGGYSGIFPPSYTARRTWLEHPLANPDEAWKALAGSTHAIVHTAAWTDGTGDRIARWLQQEGARELGRSDGARVFELPVARPSASSPAGRPF